ncbi:kinase-like protein [Rhizopogon salebrosus TDB-379]|nr:kinase-like protein [Rhizopogon salebrosus TDB-379]
MILPLDCNIVSIPTLPTQLFKPHVGSVHSKSIVHGNLTGSNVLVHGNGRACLAGFGLSAELFKELEDDEDNEAAVSTIRGEIRWAAAELFKEPEDDEEDEAAVSLSTECDIYSFGSIFLQVLTCKVPYYNVKRYDVVLRLVIRGKKPEPPKDSVLAPVHWEFIQRCWLPRPSRPSIGKIVTFVARERCLAAGKSLMDVRGIFVNL